MEKMRNKVEKMLIKHGNNPQDVKEMMSENFDYAYKTYSTASSIARAISILR